ncbi:sterol esterase NDAI_0I02080 [Naumovozyma dairenensis CBS 421]|uniref:sterol esterase n=1 Tax=Naumovozyma dairenensis (strain ATCC 10597 / BCRC 20456 / CBS 421 / NBRC 0211 / NRRL Y-12639) TaxID=1071378 RepID=G0WG66_NAUDC|nr:hypothetical protein NDAI_0I02080 [Naumovozyma dairenensis CBS 421]CCD26777.1 hypothetical protein NDAI_0I02080 [Naumovozyma dairenensis CBS 421]
MSFIVQCLQGIVSAIILNIFMTVLFILSLWHNYVTVHIKKRVDPRDTRSSKTSINEPKNKAYKSSKYSKQRKPSVSSVSSETPLDSENERMSNIEYDHTITSLASAPHPTLIEGANQTSNPFPDILLAEDHKLVADLSYYYNQYDIEIETFEVETDDGFIIDLWHLKSSKQQERDISRRPILMLHGLLQSSGAFASGGRKSLAYFLHESGFDIWLGNNRCGLKAKWNMEKVGTPAKKWDWDLNEMVKYDLKALIEKTLSETNFEKLTLISHSQGTTQGFMGLINGEELYDKDFKLIDKLDNYIALAPAIYPGPLLDEKGFVRFMAMGIDSPWVFGTKSFIPLMMTMRSIMLGTKLYSFLSYIMFNYLFDWNDILWDRPLRNRHFLFSPVHISVKLMEWWLSPKPSKTSFKNGAGRMFPDNKVWFPVADSGTAAHGRSVENHLNMKRDTDVEYPYIMMFIPRQDRLVDGERLINHFIHNEKHSLFKIWYIDEYSHLDVLWAHDVIERIGKPIVENLRFPQQTI